jgi:hypothetical protein
MARLAVDPNAVLRTGVVIPFGQRGIAAVQSGALINAIAHPAQGFNDHPYQHQRFTGAPPPGTDPMDETLGPGDGSGAPGLPPPQVIGVDPGSRQLSPQQQSALGAFAQAVQTAAMNGALSGGLGDVGSIQGKCPGGGSVAGAICRAAQIMLQGRPVVAKFGGLTVVIPPPFGFPQMMERISLSSEGGEEPPVQALDPYNGGSPLPFEEGGLGAARRGASRTSTRVRQGGGHGYARGAHAARGHHHGMSRAQAHAQAVAEAQARGYTSGSGSGGGGTTIESTVGSDKSTVGTPPPVIAMLPMMQRVLGPSYFQQAHMNDALGAAHRSRSSRAHGGHGGHARSTHGHAAHGRHGRSHGGGGGQTLAQQQAAAAAAAAAAQQQSVATATPFAPPQAAMPARIISAPPPGPGATANSLARTPATCPPGFRLVGNQCIQHADPIDNTATPICPPGSMLVNGNQCQPSASSTPTASAYTGSGPSVMSTTPTGAPWSSVPPNTATPGASGPAAGTAPTATPLSQNQNVPAPQQSGGGSGSGGGPSPSAPSASVAPLPESGDDGFAPDEDQGDFDDDTDSVSTADFDPTVAAVHGLPW